MTNSKSTQIDILRLYPLTDESLKTFSSAVVNILLAPEDIIPKSDRRRADTLKLLKKMMQFSSCSVPTLLTRSTCIETIYKSENVACVEFVKSLKNVNELVLLGRATLNSLLSTELKNDILREIVGNLYADDCDEAHTFLCELWALRESVPLTQEFVEEMSRHFPFCIEQHLLLMAQRIVSEQNEEFVETILNEEHLQPFFNLCSKSTKVFQMTITILHEILLVSNVHKRVVTLIKEFINRVRSVCQTCQFLELFPPDVRILITYLQISPGLYPEDFPDEEFTKESVLNRLITCLSCQRRIGGALLSYYPEWLPNILEHCCRKNVASLIPPKGVSETPENYLKFILHKHCVSGSNS